MTRWLARINAQLIIRHKSAAQLNIRHKTAAQLDIRHKSAAQLIIRHKSALRALRVTYGEENTKYIKLHANLLRGDYWRIQWGALLLWTSLKATVSGTTVMETGDTFCTRASVYGTKFV